MRAIKGQLELLADDPPTTPTPTTRPCRACGQPFVPMTGEAGSKYCSTVCKRKGYGIGHTVAPLPVRQCQSCDKAFQPLHGNHRYCSITCRDRHDALIHHGGLLTCAWCGTQRPSWSTDERVSRSRTWPYVCNQCLAPIRHVVARLRKHHVAFERVRQLRDDPTCEVCGVDIVELVVRRGGNMAALLHVDHDHRCCPGSVSCGKCVRGLVCAPCNIAVGGVRNDPDVARRLVVYLEGHDRGRAQEVRP
jgi:hypothetical protein